VLGGLRPPGALIAGTSLGIKPPQPAGVAS